MIPPLPFAPPAIADRDFRALRDRIYQRAGIFFVPAKKALIVSRLQRRTRELGLELKAYIQLALSDAAEETRMLELLCTHETSFFREAQHWELLRRHVLPRWREEAEAGARPRRVRVLSAGCSSGEEPYSAAMELATGLPGFAVEVVAGDVSPRIVERAAQGEWPLERAKQIPEPMLRRFMLRNTEGVMRAGPELRSLLRFTRLNLGQEAHPGLGVFDLIFCRNVLIYFDQASKARAIRSLLPHLDPRGLFFVGHAESLTGISEELQTVIPTVYRRRG